jgi:hypothetical protein
VGATYEDLEEIYNRVVGSGPRSSGTSPASRRRVQAGEGGRPARRRVHADPRARQKAAVAFLAANAFATPDLPARPEHPPEDRASGSIDRVGAAQRRVLNTLLDNARLQRMIEIEGMPAAARRPVARRRLPARRDARRRAPRRVGEIYRGQAIDPYRRASRSRTST